MLFTNIKMGGNVRLSVRRAECWCIVDHLVQPVDSNSVPPIFRCHDSSWRDSAGC